jgi:PDZ domain-containing protein
MSVASAMMEGVTDIRGVLLSVSCFATVALLAVTLVLPTGFAVRGPGPTEDTLGSQNGTPLVSIADGTPSYPSTGQLRLTTVQAGGGPVSDVFALDVLGAWASTQQAVLPVEAVFAVGTTPQEQAQQGQQQMLSSQEQAIAAALTQLGYTVPVVLTVAGTPDQSPSAGLVQVGDVLRTLDGEEITTYADLLDRLTAVTPGSEVVLGVDRPVGGSGTKGEGSGATGEPKDSGTTGETGAPGTTGGPGEPGTTGESGESSQAGQPGAVTRVDVTITTTSGTTNNGGTRAALGLFLGSTFNFPVDVRIQIENIGGPSAGLMFALAIMDKLTEQDELNGASVAGTGTIDIDGTVGPIGGIEQKLRGALRDGATWFFAPASNCDEVVGNVPRGLRVVKVSTLSQAYDAIVAIGAGHGDGLPTCS